MCIVSCFEVLPLFDMTLFEFTTYRGIVTPPPTSFLRYSYIVNRTYNGHFRLDFIVRKAESIRLHHTLRFVLVTAIVGFVTINPSIHPTIHDLPSSVFYKGQ